MTGNPACLICTREGPGARQPGFFKVWQIGRLESTIRLCGGLPARNVIDPYCPNLGNGDNLLDGVCLIFHPSRMVSLALLLVSWIVSRSAQLRNQHLHGVLGTTHARPCGWLGETERGEKGAFFLFRVPLPYLEKGADSGRPCYRLSQSFRFRSNK